MKDDRVSDVIIGIVLHGTNTGGTGRAVHKLVISDLTKEYESAEHWLIMNHFRRKKSKENPFYL